MGEMDGLNRQAAKSAKKRQERWGGRLTAEGAEDTETRGGPLVLIARIEAILRRTEGAPAPSAGQLIAAGNLATNPHSHEVTLGGEPVRLTPWVPRRRALAALTSP